jgi:hypothetical protein
MINLHGRWAAVLAMTAVGLAGCGSAVSAPKLSQDEAKAAIAATCATCTFTWKDVQIAAPRAASAGEISAAGLPPHAVVYPVHASFTRKMGFTRDVTWNYFVFKDDFGKWSVQSNAMPGNVESEPY